MSLLFLSSFSLQATTYNINIGETYSTLENLRGASVLADGDEIVLHKADDSLLSPPFIISNIAISLKSASNAQMTISTGTSITNFFSVSASTFNVENVKFANGLRLGESGGAIKMVDSISTFSNASFEGNTSVDTFIGGGKGGALYLEKSSADFRDAIFKNNQAVDGGAIYADNSMKQRFLEIIKALQHLQLLAALFARVTNQS